MRILASFILAVHIIAAVIPLFDHNESNDSAKTAFDEWPKQYEGLPLIPLNFNAADSRFSGNFPGRLARFTDGEREILFRYIERPTRALHASTDCYRGSGYHVEPKPLRRDANGALMGCFEAKLNGQSFHVCERVFDTSGGSWYDVSSWYWATILKQSPGPWWAVTVATPL